MLRSILAEAIESISAIEAGMWAWWSEAPAYDPLDPVLLCLIVIACLTGFIGRSWLGFITAGLWAALGFQLISDVPVDIRPVAVAGLFLTESLLFLFAATHRRAVDQLRRTIAINESRHRDTQAKLDREIAWRTAAEDGPVTGQPERIELSGKCGTSDPGESRGTPPPEQPREYCLA